MPFLVHVINLPWIALDCATSDNFGDVVASLTLQYKDYGGGR